MCVYLGFDDAAVEAVVLLLVQQTELQRSQRGCQKRNTGTTLEKMDPEHLFASCTINQFPLKQINIDLFLFVSPLGFYFNI